MPFLMVRGDIAKMQTDAVVIPAAGAGQPHKIRLALCRAIMRKSFGSSAPSIIYVIVPAWTDDRNKREQLLEKAYRSALRLAVKNDLRSIAFRCFPAGTQGLLRRKHSASRAASSPLSCGGKNLACI